MAKSLTLEELEKIKIMYANGETAHAIAQQLGRSQHTIQKALDNKGVIEQVKEIRQTLSEQFKTIAQRLVVSITDEDIRKSTALQRLTGAGICVDKARLLENLSTSNEQIIILNVPNTKEEYEDMLRRRNEIENND